MLINILMSKEILKTSLYQQFKLPSNELIKSSKWSFAGTKKVQQIDEGSKKSINAASRSKKIISINLIQFQMHWSKWEVSHLGHLHPNWNQILGHVADQNYITITIV